MGKFFDIKPFLQTGKEKEGEFARDLCEELGGIALPATEKQDMFDHVDVLWKYDKKMKPAKIDVKGMKKDKRNDNKPNPDIHWIEFQNVNGNLGWLYGKADCIAFETLDEWIIIKRAHLAEVMQNAVKNNSITRNINEAYYRYYQREGRKDIITKVDTTLLRNNADKIIKKHGNI